MSFTSAQDPRRIDPALREKYDVRGPRYTSYPPATHFADVDTGRLFDSWRARNRLEPDPGLSLYLHIPFCRSRCLFCGCTSCVGRGEMTDAYVQALIRESRLAAAIVDPSRPVRQVAAGGGTPNYLSPEQTRTLLSAQEETWTIADDAERSVEIDPRTATPAKLEAWLEHGFNRFSLGVQDLSGRVLRTVRRGQDLMQVEEVVATLRHRGIDSINFDLIYGLPGQDPAGMQETARRVIALGPDRIALYSYAHVPWIHPHQKALERAGLPDPDTKAALFLGMMDAFQQAGYLAIGMDHFALPGDPLARALEQRTLRRNFMGYTTGRGLDLLALGASGISSVGASYAQNRKELDAYLAEVEAERLPVFRGYLLSRDDQIRRALLLDLFCNFHADLDALSECFGIDAAGYFHDDLERLQPMVDDGLVDWNPHAIEVSDSGRFFIRTICMQFDRHLEADASRRMYSRTV